MASEFGRLFYQEHFLDHYARLLANLNALGVRGILNVGAAASVLAHPKERQLGYTRRLADAIGTNGFACELGFLETDNADATRAEVQLYKDFLSQGKLVQLYSDYNHEATSGWFAAMVMLLRKPGDAIFVNRDAATSPVVAWDRWPAQYGVPLDGATFSQPGARTYTGDDWLSERGFANGHITACRFGIRPGGTYDLTQLVPALADGSYTLINGQGPTRGTWNPDSNTYTAPAAFLPPPLDDNGKYYFTLGSAPSGGFWRKLVSVSVQMFA